jgi:hypothetical protein
MRVTTSPNQRMLVRTAIAFAFALTTSARGQDLSATPIPSTFFGMHTMSDTHNWPTVPIGAYGKGVVVRWSYVQPSCPGHVMGVDDCSYGWGQNDTFVSWANSHGLDIFFSNNGVPSWTGASGCSGNDCTGMVSNLQDWKNFVTQLVTRYDGQHGHGRMLIYECWNEPNTNAWSGTASDMVALCNAMHDIIRAHDSANHISPPTIYLAPSTEPGPGSLGCFVTRCSTLDALLNAGLNTDFDAATIHDYYNNPEDAIPYINSAKRVLANHGLSSKKIWMTEGSWGYPGYYGSIDTAHQIAYPVRTHLIHWSNGVSRYYWYAWENQQWGTLCSPENGCTPNAAAAAYGIAYNWLVGSTMTQACSASGTVWTCGLTLANGSLALAVWNTAGSSSYTPVRLYTQYKDLAGNTNSFSGALTIGIQPLLLVSTTNSALPSPPTGLTATVN